MSQVFNNLMINAVQAMPDGGTITVTANNLHELSETVYRVLQQECAAADASVAVA